MRLYNIIAINERTGKQVLLTGYPMNHKECCTMLSKMTGHKDTMNDNDVKMIILLDNVLADIMSDLDKDISSHSAMILSDESRFISEQIKTIKGKQNV